MNDNALDSFSCKNEWYLVELMGKFVDIGSEEPECTISELYGYILIYAK
jgi:hypothetical protein